MFQLYKNKIKILYIICFACIGILAILMILYKTEESALGNGQIISSERNIIKSKITGNIEKYFVKNGAELKKGELIFKYSDESIKSSIIETGQKISSLMEERETLLSLNEYKEKNYASNSRILENERTVILSKYNYQKEYIDKSLILYEAGYISKSQLDEELLILEELKQDLDKIAIKIKEEENTKSNTERKLNVLGNKYSNDMDSLDNQIGYFVNLREELELLSKDPFVKSPFDGIISFYDTHYYNDIADIYLSFDDNICDIFSDDSFIIKGQIKDKYLPFIKIGDGVTVEVAAYDRNKYGIINGIINEIYPIPIKNENDEIINYYVDIYIPDIKTVLYNGLSVTIHYKLNKKMNMLYYFIKKSILNDKSLGNKGTIYFLQRKDMQ